MNEVESGVSRRLRTPLLALAAVRGAVGLAAIPLAPALYRDHFMALVLLRPTKEVLLVGGFLVRRGDVSLLPLVAAALPLLILGVWQFFWLGRAFRDEIRDGSGLPRWAERILPPKRIKQLCGVLNDRGMPVIIAGRVAAFPSSLLAAAAGASGMKPRRFLPADATGAALSMVEVIGAGWVLGTAYKRAGPWVTAVGAAVVVGMLLYIGRSLKRSPGQATPRPQPAAAV